MQAGDTGDTADVAGAVARRATTYDARLHELIERCLTLEPDEVPGFVGLAKAQLASGSTQDAVRSLRSAH